MQIISSGLNSVHVKHGELISMRCGKDDQQSQEMATNFAANREKLSSMLSTSKRGV